MGIEALSRGAAQALFFELDKRAIATIHANLETTGLERRAEVRRGDALAYLEGTPLRIFDYVYVAPPQYQGLWKRALISLDAHPDWLSKDAWVIVQIHPREFEIVELANLEEFDQRRYGSTLLVFYVRS